MTAPMIPGINLRGASQRTHGQSYNRSPEYRTWLSMRWRVKHDELYLRRGIRVCARWDQSFIAFRHDVGVRPTLAHTIERINNAGDYEPGNVRWATNAEQQRNRSDTRLVTANGEVRPLVAWAELTGLRWSTIRSRLDRGWPAEAAISRAPHKGKRL